MAATLLLASACQGERDMPESMQMPDSMEVMRAMQDPVARDEMLDTMPGGEMARGDDAASQALLKEKMPGDSVGGGGG